VNFPVTNLPMSFDLWRRAGCPVEPVRNLKEVWPTSPYGKSRGDQTPSPPTLREQLHKKKGKR